MENNQKEQSIYPYIFNLCKSGFNKSLARWSTARTKNVNNLHELWEKNPLRVEVLEDPRFDNDHLIIMKRVYLEKLIKEHELLMESVKVKRGEIEILVEMADLIKNLSVESNQEKSSALKNALDLFVKLTGKVAVV